MDIREALLTEHSKRQTIKIVEFIGNDAKKFKVLMGIFLGENYRLTQRAAWSVNYCAENNPKLVKPFLEILLNQLERTDVHNAVKRNIVRLLQYVEIPEKLLGKTYSICVDLIDNPNEPVAVRAFALTIATNIAKSEPDLIKELQLVVNKHLPHTSAAFEKRAREVLSY